METKEKWNKSLVSDSSANNVRNSMNDLKEKKSLRVLRVDKDQDHSAYSASKIVYKAEKKDSGYSSDLLSLDIHLRPPSTGRVSIRLN